MAHAVRSQDRNANHNTMESTVTQMELTSKLTLEPVLSQDVRSHVIHQLSLTDVNAVQSQDMKQMMFTTEHSQTIKTIQSTVLTAQL
jgi:hypothetical protein